MTMHKDLPATYTGFPPGDWKEAEQCGWTCCCKGTIRDPHDPSGSMVCCGEFEWFGNRLPNQADYERRYEFCTANRCGARVFDAHTPPTWREAALLILVGVGMVTATVVGAVWLLGGV